MLPSGNASSGAFPLPEPGPKLLFDENLAPRLVPALADLYPGSAHVRNVGLGGTADLSVWEHAAAGGFLLVSKDEDFHRLSVLLRIRPRGCSGTSPKAGLVRRGELKGAVYMRAASDQCARIPARIYVAPRGRRCLRSTFRALVSDLLTGRRPGSIRNRQTDCQ